MSAPCPHCGKPTKIADRAFFNADQYGQRCLVKTDCCGRGVWLTPERSYRITAYNGKEPYDDWGDKIRVPHDA